MKYLNIKSLCKAVVLAGMLFVAGGVEPASARISEQEAEAIGYMSALDAREAGYVEEKPDGYVKETASKHKDVAKKINDRRRAKYAEIAKEKGKITPEDYGKIAAQRIQEKIKLREIQEKLKK